MRQRIEQAHADYARHGFVTTQRSWGRDVNGVAIPFSTRRRNTLYAFNFAGPANRMPVTQLRRTLGPMLVRMAQELHAEMDRSPGPQLMPPEIYRP